MRKILSARVSFFFPKPTGRRYVPTSNDPTTPIDGEIKLGVFSMVTAGAFWLIADRIDPLRSHRYNGSGHMGAMLCCAYVFMLGTGFQSRIPVYVAFFATVHNICCIRNPLSVNEKIRLDEYTNEFPDREEEFNNLIRNCVNYVPDFFSNARGGLARDQKQPAAPALNSNDPTAVDASERAKTP